ncbi:MAG: glycoside hydrolase family 57 protein [Candidatus Altiarchaeota archaeon]|nr:glycoside hydrolase family 57 protein [Candidatus Altiarchaeota archaeon]
MVAVCFYFQVHQPYRMRKYPVFDVGRNSDYFDSGKNASIMRKVAEKCYLPANRLMLDIIRDTGGRFKASYSISGTALDQFQEYCPKVLDTFRDLVDTGCVEILDETYYHSLSFLYSRKEFREQVKMHRDKVKELFGCRPAVFRNTELVYNNQLAHTVEEMGYDGVIAEGADHVLGWRSPNFLYRPQGTKKIKLLLKNYRLSDDIAFRFSERSWSEWPLTAEKFSAWVNAVNGNGHTVNLFMDYETFGEHQWESTGIFHFLRQLPHEILKNPDNCFMTPGELVSAHDTVGELDVPHLVSWADVERDLSAWLANPMQKSSAEKLYRFEEDVRKSGDPKLLEDWRRLQTADHLYYMCTKWFNDGDVHKYFNVYDRPHDSFIAFMNVLTDFGIRLAKHKMLQPQPC